MPVGLYSNLYWIIPAAIVLICVAVGYRDIARLRPGRVLAIADACFTESIRRKVLLVTPLAILGLIIVVQLQQPATDQDRIHQTTRFCLFASGLLVVVIAIILSCTNLPREIENRVIYTIVTKPTTRLEIVLGKIVGFAGVSAAILLIMGLFTFAYLEVRNYELVSKIKQDLAVLPADSPQRPTLAYYASAGLLATKSLDQATSLQVYSHPPGQPDAEHPAGYLYSGGGVGNFFAVPFDLSEEQIATLQQAQAAKFPVLLKCDLHIVQHPPTDQQWKDIKMLRLRPRGGKASPTYGPALPSTQPVNANSPDRWPVPMVSVRVLDQSQNAITEFGQLDGPGIPVDVNKPGFLALKPDLVDHLLQAPKFFLEFSAATPAVEYGANASSISLIVPNPNDKDRPLLVIHSSGPIDFQARPTRYGQQLVSRDDASGPVADFHFQNAQLPSESSGAGKSQMVPFELTVFVERPGSYEARQFNLAKMSIQFFNRTTGNTSQPIPLTPELGRSNYVEVPRAHLTGGNFDLLVRGLSNGQLLDVKPDSAVLITADRSFAFNLFKSLFILWMLSVLVVIISVFCSTFLSWPIAVVLTLVILLGHWGVNELGDAMQPGIGRSVTTDFQMRDPVSSKVVSTSVDKLAQGLRILAIVLPDVSKFPVMEDIERNIAIPLSSVEEAVEVLLLFGLPLLLLSYVILKNKEVAP